MFSKTILIVAAAALLTIASFNMAQQAGQPTTTPATDDAAAARAEAVRQSQLKLKQKMLQSTLAKIKTDLASSDEEFAVLQPLIEKCMTTRDVVRQNNDTASFGVARLFDMGKRGIQTLPPKSGPTPATRAQQDLDILLHDPNATLAAIQAQMQVVRQELKQANDDHTAACKELRALVTRRQEVALFLDDVLN